MSTNYAAACPSVSYLNLEIRSSKKSQHSIFFQILPNVGESFTALYSRIHQHYRISSAATTQAKTREQFKYFTLIFGLVHLLRRQKGDMKQNVTHVPEAFLLASSWGSLTFFVFFFGPFT